MAHTIDGDKFVTVYDTRTGQKVPHKVPRAHLALFPYLSLTPKAKAAEAAKPTNPQADKATDKKG